MFSRSSQAGFVALMGMGVLVSMLSTGCQPSQKRLGPWRSIWITRYDYKTAEQVERIVDKCADAGFNALLFQVRGNGTAFYNSSFEPWADELGGSDPGFDPLELACRKAHERGMQLHAYVNVMPAWRGTKPPANPEQLYNKRPEWFWYDQYGNRQGLSSFYVSLNPCWPEVRTYIVDVFEEIVRDYDIDGLHLDYIRFPDEPPATPRGTDIDYPHDERTLAYFRDASGGTPQEHPEAWKQWRADQVSTLVADIHDMIQKTKPEVVLSAAVGSIRERALSHHQDSYTWIEAGSIDAMLLMNYTNSPQTFRERIEPWLETGYRVPIVPGLWFGKINKDRSVDQGAKSVNEQIKIARELTGNFCVFAYSSIFDSDDDQLTKQNKKEGAKREQRRKIVLPLLGALPEADQSAPPEALARWQ
ncbi:MAG: family 10 glycosylhydrolase [bacterium]|nr:family 10 glycosylhydrolase [bacterium]